MTPISRFLVALASVCLLSTAFAGAAIADDCHDECESGSWAGFTGFTSGSVTLNTQLGTTTIPVMRGSLEAAAISTTGTVEVEIAYRCVEAYHFVVTKQPNGLAGAVVVYDAWAYPACSSGVDMHSVPIGLDGGHYTFELTWYGCDGTAGKDHRDLIIFDPPVPTPGLSL